MAGNAVEPGRSVASKVICILSAFTSGPEFTLSDIARLSGLPISTAHRLVAELLHAGMLHRTGDSRYRPGTQLKRIAGNVPVAAPSLHERARRVLEDLAAACPRQTVRLGVLDGLAVAFMEKDGLTRPVSIGFGTATLPLHATALGKALLAFANPEILDRLISEPLHSYTEFTITRPSHLLRVLASVRAARVAVARQEFAIGRFDVAVPVFGGGDVVAAALEVSLCRPGDLDLVRPALAMAAHALSRELRTKDARFAIMAGGERQLETMLRYAYLAGQLDRCGSRSAMAI
jgi:DNA-binding IclR family transcriptional regulator